MFLPVNKDDMLARGWDAPDFVLVTGDAYVDHPSFAHAVISRLLESLGYKVAVLAQPDWRDPRCMEEFGAPKLGFLVSGGNLDSMVCHYSVAKNRRRTDFYSPGGRAGLRPDRAVTVYSRLIKASYPDIPLVIGGTEASLRRFSHYDYWSDSVMPSILADSGADILVYGMGELAMGEIASALSAGIPPDAITGVDGTAYLTRDISALFNFVRLQMYEDVVKDKKKYAKSFYKQYINCDHFTGKTLVEPYLDGFFAVQNRPPRPMSADELDAVYELPYERRSHPMYDEAGGVPAIDEVKFSLTSCRGCFGACSFCALGYHQGRIVQARSHASLLREARALAADPDFKGYIHDVGGPTANFRHPACDKQLNAGVCPSRQCLFPEPCENLDADHSDYVSLLRELRALPKVKKVFVRSGIRFDYLLCEHDGDFLQELVKYHVSGQLKVAPEHVSDAVLQRMGKPPHRVFARFKREFDEMNRRLGLKQYLVPYLMSSHPGCTLKDAVELAEYLRDEKLNPEQVQDFYPTPSTVSTCMYYTGLDPRDMSEVYVPRSKEEKEQQRALLQFRFPENADVVRKALVRAGRRDLIGYGEKCLVAPDGGQKPRQTGQKGRSESGGNTVKMKTSPLKRNPQKSPTDKKTITEHKKKQKR